MNDLRYNMYGGARYPAPAVVGSFGTGVGGAIGNSMANSWRDDRQRDRRCAPEASLGRGETQEVGACRYRQADRSLSRNQERPGEGGGHMGARNLKRFALCAAAVGALLAAHPA